MPDENTFYRFRPISRLLGKTRELEKQEIYLGAYDELNDPMEGYQDIFWKGDQILWRNLLKHYLLSLLWNASSCALMSDDEFEEPQVVGTLTQDDLPTDEFRKLYQGICIKFDEDGLFSRLSDRLGKLRFPLYIDGLRMVLRVFHLPAFLAVVSSMHEAGLLSSGWFPPEFRTAGTRLSQTPEKLVSIIEMAPDSQKLEELASISNQTYERSTMDLLLRPNRDIGSGTARRKQYLISSFPDLYAKTIAETLIHGNWHTACFSSKCTNASMWSSYADNHKGAALMFTAHSDKNGNPFLPLSIVNGVGSGRGKKTRYYRKTVPVTLHKVKYSNRPPQTDFFKFISNLSWSKLAKTWHSDGSGQISPVLKRINNNQEMWREQLWKLFYRRATTKLKDWSHEREYRIVLSDLVGLRHDSDNRLARFDLSDLSGVVFGLRTKPSDKAEIIETIRAKGKAENTSHIQFYQMTYSRNKGVLERI